jgi:hypothetical protein
MTIGLRAGSEDANPRQPKYQVRHAGVDTAIVQVLVFALASNKYPTFEANGAERRF